MIQEGAGFKKKRFALEQSKDCVGQPLTCEKKKLILKDWKAKILRMTAIVFHSSSGSSL